MRLKDTNSDNFISLDSIIPLSQPQGCSLSTLDERIASIGINDDVSSLVLSVSKSIDSGPGIIKSSYGVNFCKAGYSGDMCDSECPKTFNASKSCQESPILIFR